MESENGWYVQNRGKEFYKLKSCNMLVSLTSKNLPKPISRQVASSKPYQLYNYNSFKVFLLNKREGFETHASFGGPKEKRGTIPLSTFN